MVFGVEESTPNCSLFTPSNTRCPSGTCKKVVTAFYGRTPKRLSRQPIQRLMEDNYKRSKEIKKAQEAWEDDSGEYSDWNQERFYVSCAQVALQVLLDSPKTPSEDKKSTPEQAGEGVFGDGQSSPAESSQAKVPDICSIVSPAWSTAAQLAKLSGSALVLGKLLWNQLVRAIAY